MDGSDDVCLGLGLGLNDQFTPQKREHTQKNKCVFFLDLSSPLHHSDHGDSSSSLKVLGKDEIRGRRDSFFSGDKEDDDSNCSMDFSRKKLRLTRDQTTLLEDSFKQHTALNTAQKQALAEKLNLKPRQVEVWFQNRRARTKLKQTEVDCVFLKKNCERLSEENWRLKKELLELRSSLKSTTEKPQPPPACATPSPPYLHHNPMAAGSRENDRGSGEKQEAAAAAVTEVVHEP